MYEVLQRSESLTCIRVCMTTGGMHKSKIVHKNVGNVRIKNCIKKNWECSHESWLGQQIRYMNDSMPVIFLFWGRRQGRQPLRT